MVFNATFNTLDQLYRGSKFYWWRKPENPEKTTDLSQEVTEKLIYTFNLFQRKICEKTEKKQCKIQQRVENLVVRGGGI